MGVQTRTVDAGDGDMRLDRWFKREFPSLGHGRLEKLLRTGQVRVDGRRVKANERLQEGATIRVPPLGDLGKPQKATAKPDSRKAESKAKELRQAVLFEDSALIVINKPSGLPVQGGSKSDRHVDGALEWLVEKDAERPRLVHRLDKDTSGLLLLAKTRQVAATLGFAFQSGEIVKEYWAICAGKPDREAGIIDMPIAKRKSGSGEKMVGDEDGKRATTDMRLIAHAGDKLCWLALRPGTGRTHQLRVHCAAIDAPILGDGKYGGSTAFPKGAHAINRLHLHARRLQLRHPTKNMLLDLEAPLPSHMADSFSAFGFSERDYDADIWEAQ